MKSWKQVPHLFANGKFKVQHSYGDTYTGRIVGIDGVHNPRVLSSEEGGVANPRISDCQLIARKIEDMTDEELVWFLDDFGRSFLKPCEEMKSLLIELSNTKQLDASTFLQLISIGVYPFDQKAFETGEVLDAKEVL